MTSTILIVDDASIVRKQVTSAIQKMGHIVVEAVDGIDALSKLDACPDTSLIVCDVHMPNMNGLEFLERLHARGSNIPVIMLTAEGEPESIRRAKALGARAWIVKPFKPESFVTVVEKLMANSPPSSAASGQG